MPRKTVLAIVAVAVGAAAIAGALAGVLSTRVESSAGTVPLLETAAAQPEPSVSSQPAVALPAPLPGSSTGRPAPARPSPSTGEPGRLAPEIGTRSARVGDLRGGKDPAPVGLRIPALEVDAPIVPVGVEPRTGLMELPPDRRTVAWYRHGSTPGASGSAVLAGHVDYGDGRAVFFELAKLDPGSTVVVSYADGSRRRFRVVGRRLYDKERLPRGIFAATGKPVLALITCGGGYDRSERSYDGNVVVFAVPV